MGDPRRFALFADLIAREFPETAAHIADVAGGKGYLKAELYRRGFRRVTCWDRRRRLANGRPGQRYQLFDYRNAPREYDLVVAMHPDEGTDHALLYSAKHRVPCAIVPCCLTPSAVPYDGRQTWGSWNAHLVELARARRLRVEVSALPMAGRSVVLVARPA